MTPCSVLGYSYFTKCSEKSEHNLQVTGTIEQSSRFFFIRVFKEVLSSEFVE